MELTMQKAKCPSCKQIITLQEEIKVQGLVVCPQCKSFLELVNNYPPTLALIADLELYSRQGKLTKFQKPKQVPIILADSEKSA